MGTASTIDDARLADRLKTLRQDRGWSLDALAAKSGVSRATLSRMENGETSPTARALGQLAACYGMTASRLMALTEAAAEALIRREDQPVWVDPASGFERRSVSPPADDLAGEALDCRLPPGAAIAYDAPPRPGLEHHLVLLDGGLRLEADGAGHDLRPGDCARYRLFGASAFKADATAGARYLLFIL